MPDFSRVIRDAYLEILERPPDPGGLADFNARMNDGLGEAALREVLLRSDEYAAKNPFPSPPSGDMALRVEGRRFLNPRGEEVRLLGAIVCCAEAKQNGWPLVTVETLDLFAARRLNYTHCRLGPFTVAGEDEPGFVGYVTVPDGRVDLEQWFPGFWNRTRDIARRARDRRIWVEFDLVDRWVRQHGASDLPEVDPWSARNNVQGVEAGGLEIFERAPGPIHERWVRKAVAELGEFENVLFQVGNEGFKSFSAAWEVGVYELVRDELRRRGLGARLVATNTQDPALEARLDYVNRHSSTAQPPGDKPILVNEYPSLPPDEVLRQVRRARQLGTTFHYWRGDHDRPSWDRTLGELRGVVDADATPARVALRTASPRGSTRSARPRTGREMPPRRADRRRRRRAAKPRPRS
jgi:hypothetical protein